MSEPAPDDLTLAIERVEALRGRVVKWSGSIAFPEAQADSEALARVLSAARESQARYYGSYRIVGTGTPRRKETP